MPGKRILVVDDEPDIVDVVTYNLRREGFEVESCTRGDLALEAARRRPPDLLLLDLMLPGIDGLELARVLKRSPETAGVPIVILSARSDEVDRIVGLELGADDYVPKPFSPRELVLRVKAVLRRVDSADLPRQILHLGELELDVGGHRLLLRGEEVPLTATEFRLLHTLASRAGRVQTRERLLTDVWQYADEVDSRTVDTHIRRLRRKLGSESHRVETVIGVGYRFRS